MLVLNLIVNEIWELPPCRAIKQFENKSSESCCSSTKTEADEASDNGHGNRNLPLFEIINEKCNYHDEIKKEGETGNDDSRIVAIMETTH